MTHGNRDLRESGNALYSRTVRRLFLRSETKGSTCSFCSGSCKPRSWSCQHHLSDMQWAGSRHVGILILQPRKWSCWEHHKDSPPSAPQMEGRPRCSGCHTPCARGSVSSVLGAPLWVGEEALGLGAEDLECHSRPPIH